MLEALLPYMPEDVGAYVAENKDKLTITHFNYDWGLNGSSPGAHGEGGRC